MDWKEGPQPRGPITTLVVMTTGEIRVDEGVESDLDYLHKCIGTGLIVETVHGEGWVAYLNEDATVLGESRNERAEALFVALAGQQLGQEIRGEVVFTGPPDELGFDTSVPERVIELAREGNEHDEQQD